MARGFTFLSFCLKTKSAMLSSLVTRAARRSLRQAKRPLHGEAAGIDGPGVYSNHSPIVGHLWEARRKSLAIATARNAPVFERNPKGVLMKAPSDSSTSIRYNFSTNSSLVEEYR
jgi:hypothetical protein